ncbi:MAG: maleylpyruvate isomerase N-terminal domain-containing protein [Candidatus Limnocylindria bacterium]
MADDRLTALLAELDAARGAFLAALADVDAELVTVPGVMEDWSVRDLVVHVAAWAEHGTDALALAIAGRGDEFAYSGDQTDAMNVEFLAQGRETSPRDALKREERAFAAFRERIGSLDTSALTHRLGNGDTAEEVILYDGAHHYAEHTAHLRAWFGADDDEIG